MLSRAVQIGLFVTDPIVFDHAAQGLRRELQVERSPEARASLSSRPTSLSLTFRRCCFPPAVLLLSSVSVVKVRARICLYQTCNKHDLQSNKIQILQNVCSRMPFIFRSCVVVWLVLLERSHHAISVSNDVSTEPE